MSIRPRANLEELQRLQKAKTTAGYDARPLGGGMIDFFKQSVAKRQTKLGKIADCWTGLIPAKLIEHCALESFSRGQLVVIVDSSPHLYELKQQLLSGLQKELLQACKSTGLRKIQLKAGRWYEGDRPENRRLQF
jgi:hypothetical protein